jgi:hypothetical protein
MSSNSDESVSPEISRYAFALFDVLGFSKWIESEPLDSILNTYKMLIARVVRPDEKGGLSAVQIEDGPIFGANRPAASRIL